jgi:hypothetical protein
MHDDSSLNILELVCTVCMPGENSCWVMAALLQWRVNVYCHADYRAAIGGKQFDTPGSYTATHRLKTSSS